MAKNITRIDRPSPEVAQQLARVLSESPFFSKRHPVRFTTKSGHVTLHGTVQSYYQKQMAQEILRDVPGVTQIENRLEVAWPLEPTADGHHDVCELAPPAEVFRHDTRGFEPSQISTHNEQGLNHHGTRWSSQLQGESTHASR